MFEFLRRLLHGAARTNVQGTQSQNQIRYYFYRDRLDLTNKPLILLSGATIESARDLIPFLRLPAEMISTIMSRDETIAYNGQEADEMYAFANVTQAGAKLTRILVRDGRIIELTIKG